MKIELTVTKTADGEKYMVKASTSATNGSMRPKKKELALDDVKAFVGKIITDLDNEGKIGTK